MVEVKVKRFVIFSIDPNKSGYLRRTINGRYGFTPDLVRAEFFYDKDEADEIIEYWGRRLKIALHTKPVGVVLTEDTTESYTLPETELKALQGLYMERIRQIRQNTHTLTYEQEQKLLSTGANLLELLGKLYRADKDLLSNFQIPYKGYHIIGIPSHTDNSSAVEIRDYSLPGTGSKLIRKYLYLKGDIEKRESRVRMAKIYIDQMDIEYRIDKHL